MDTEKLKKELHSEDLGVLEVVMGPGQDLVEAANVDAGQATAIVDYVVGIIGMLNPTMRKAQAARIIDALISDSAQESEKALGE